jgi:hypothetical protein
MRSGGICLRPSTETAMHCIFRDRVVVHVHSVNTIVWAVRSDAPMRLAEQLSDLYWQWVPYARPGLPLALQISKLLASSPRSNVFVLGNHGLVVCGNDCGSVESLLAEVERRLSVVPRTIPKHHLMLDALTEDSSSWRLPAVEALHALGTDLICTQILKAGFLLPCQVTLGGPKIRILPYSVPFSQFAQYANGRDGEPRFVVVEGGGSIVHNQMTTDEEAMLTGLARILLRTEECAPVRYLNKQEVTELAADARDDHRVEANGSETVMQT